MLIGIACEDGDHFRVATRLVKDAAVREHHWLDGIVESCIEWCGLSEGESWHALSKAELYDISPYTAEGVTIRPLGFIGTERQLPEAGMWRKVLLQFCHAKPRPDVVVLVRDSDGKADRRLGLEQVRRLLQWPFPVVFGLADPEIEAWLVCGFEPMNADEGKRLDELCRELSFNPIQQSHRLTSRPNAARTDAKRVLKRLCGTLEEREDVGLSNRSRLLERGTHNGLADFMNEVETIVVPLLGRSS